MPTARPALVLAALTLAGCAAHTQASRRAPPKSFTSKQELAELAARPPPAEVFDESTVTVDRWELSGPFPDSVAVVPHPPASAWDGLLEAAVKAKPGALLSTEDLHCIAREVGRFRLEKNGLPARALADFIYGRCGASAVAISTHFLFGEVPKNTSEERVFSAWKAQVEKMMAEHLVGGNRSAGIWFGQAKGRAVVVLATGVRQTHLSPLAFVPGPQGSYQVQGELLIPAERIEALINRGRFGFAHCTPDPKVQLPRFSFQCTPSREDGTTWIEVNAFPAGRVLGDNVLSLLGLPAGAPVNVWQRAPYAASTPLASPDRFSEELYRLVNAVRAQANLGPLELSAPQSQTATRVAPHYFAAVVGAERETVGDAVALGMMAGWDLDTRPLLGRFGFAWNGAQDVGALLSQMLEQPSGRAVLLDPSASRIAIGGMVDAKRSILATIVSTYVLPALVDPAGTVRDLVARLNRVRTERGLPPALWVAWPGDVGERAAQRLAAGEDPNDVLEFALVGTQQVVHRSLTGWVVPAKKFDELQFPEELITRTPLGVFVTVASHQPEGEPWVQYVALFVLTATNDTTRTAEHRPPGKHAAPVRASGAVAAR